jgi:hypothetical protein
VLAHRQVLEEPRLVGEERERALGGHGSAARSWPAMRTLPELIGMMPARHRSVEVFPAPFGPTRPSTSPGRTEKERLRTAVKRRIVW